MTSERVDAEGVNNVAQAAKNFLPQRAFRPEVETVISMRSKEDLEVWEKLDDTIMGGKSGSFLQVLPTCLILHIKCLHGLQMSFDQPHAVLQLGLWLQQPLKSENDCPLAAPDSRSCPE